MMTKLHGHLKADAVNRITREIRKSLPEAKKAYKGYDGVRLTLSREEYIQWWLQSCCMETTTEINNLIRIIIEEVEDESN